MQGSLTKLAGSKFHLFLSQRPKNIWELVDGLKRLSTVLSFFSKLKDKEKNNLVLEKASILA